jgi:hypothetical protein
MSTTLSGFMQLFSNSSIIPGLIAAICVVLMSGVVQPNIAAAQGLPTVSVGDVAVNEGDGPVVFNSVLFPITLSAPSQVPVSVLASTQFGTAGAADFQEGSSVITFAPGQTSTTLTIIIKPDTIVEGSEDFFLNLSNPVNATIGDGQAVCTIIDDDALVLLSQPSSQRAAALDSVLFTRDPFPNVNSLNFSLDQRTRITLLGIGLKLGAGDNASAVTATAEDSLGTVRPLSVESVRLVPQTDWLYQVVAKLNDQITLVGDVKVRITVHGVTSNFVLVGTKPQ